VADIKMNYGDNGKRQWKEDMSTIEREDHTNWFFSNLSENNVTFDNSCLVLSSRREEGDDKKRSWENMRRKRWERKAGGELLYLSIRDSRSSSLKLPGLLGIASAYYIHVLYGGQWCSTRDSLLFLFLSFSALSRFRLSETKNYYWNGTQNHKTTPQPQFYVPFQSIRELYQFLWFTNCCDRYFIYEMPQGCRYLCSQPIMFWTKSKGTHWANEQRTRSM